LDVDVVVARLAISTVAGELELDFIRSGLSQIVQHAPTPGPPHMRGGRRPGSFPARIASRAFFRSVLSSLI
jgi:hypothetical protein